MNNKNIAAFLILTGVFIASCNKTDNPATDYPLVSITSPSAGQIFSKNAIHITGMVSASASDESHLLHELSVTVKSLPDSAVIFSVWKSAHDMERCSIDTSFSSSLTGGAVIIVEAENHLGKIGKQSIGFTIN